MRIPALLAAAAILLSACGTTETPAGPQPAESSAASGPIKVTDSRGKTIELKAAAKRVVVLEWGETEILTSLGVMPVGAADTKGYKTWNSVAPLDASVKDVGTRAEPSVDAIVALDPDLVVMTVEGESLLVPQLEKYVPVLVTKSSDASRNFDRLRGDVKMIAQAAGRTAEGDKLLSDMDAKLADGKKALQAKAGTPFMMADGWLEGSTVSIRPFGKGSLVSDTAEQLGLKNAWTGQVDPQWGLGQTDVEGLTALTDPNTVLFYSASEDDVFTTGLDKNPVWQRLPFVASRKVYKLQPGTWTFGGPRTIGHITEQFVKALA